MEEIIGIVKSSVYNPDPEVVEEGDVQKVIMSYGEHDADYEERPGWEGDEDMMEEEYDDMGTGAGVEGDLEMGDDD